MSEKKLVRELTWLISYCASHYEELIPKNKKTAIRSKLESLKTYVLEEIEDATLRDILNNRMICIIEIFQGKYCSNEEICKHMIAHLSYCLVMVTDPWIIQNLMLQ